MTNQLENTLAVNENQKAKLLRTKPLIYPHDMENDLNSKLFKVENC